MASTTSSPPAIDSPPKRRKISNSAEQGHPLLPGLPDHVAQLSLSLLPPSLLYSVSRSWRRVLYTPSFPPFLSLYTLSLSPQTNSLLLSAFDPLSSTWLPLPPPPEPSIFRHSSFLSRYLPIQSAAVSGKLVLHAATADNLVPAFPRPLIFNPNARNWEYGPKLISPRRWCAGGACGGALYVASGVGVQYTTLTARSVEKLDFKSKKINKLDWNWEKLGKLESEKMSREAMGAVGWREKVLVGDVTAKEGFMYEVKSDTWREMPDGMIGGWRGPAAAMDEETLYAVDKSKGVLRRYDAERDCWEDVLWAKELKGAEQITAGGGRVCVVRCGGDGIMVVDVVVSPVRFWALDIHDGSRPIAVHILPRISRPDL